jgi:hypothetical protein
VLQVFENNEDRWIVGQMCMDIDDTPVWVHDDKASCFCLLGAVHLIYRTLEERSAVEELLVSSARLLFPHLELFLADVTRQNNHTITTLNDTYLSYDDVVKLAREAKV